MYNNLILHIKIYSIILSTARAAIIELDDEHFYSEIQNHNLSLVVFYASWCDQCKNLLLKVPEIDRTLQEISSGINIFKVECDTTGKAICEDYQIEGYPILKSFRRREEYGKFEGNREVNNIIKFMQIEAAPVARKLDDFKYIEKELKQENRICLVASLRKRSKLEIIFTALAEKLRRNICFLYFSDESENTWIKMYRDPKLWNVYEDKFVQYEGKEDIIKIEEFVKRNYHGLVAIRTFSNKNEFELPIVIAYFNLDYKMDPKGTKYWHNRILKIASKYKTFFRFAMSSRNDFFDELKEVGVNSVQDNKPVIVVVLETNEKYVLRENFSVDVFDHFLHNILHKMLNPYLKSQEKPAKNDSRVIVAVGSTFYDLVVNHSNDTMLELFAEWCDYCREFSSIYEKIADMMQDENITFVKIDATLNEVPDAYSPNGYPTIYWSTKNNRRNPIEYQLLMMSTGSTFFFREEKQSCFYYDINVLMKCFDPAEWRLFLNSSKGDRTIEDFIKFIAKYASTKLKDYDRNGTPKIHKTEL